MKKLLFIALLNLSGCTTYNDLYMQDSNLSVTVPQQNTSYVGVAYPPSYYPYYGGYNWGWGGWWRPWGWGGWW